MKKEIKNFIEKNLIRADNVLDGNKANEKWFNNHNYKKEYNEILKITDFLPNNANFSLRCKHIIQNLFEIPKCLECGKKFVNHITKSYWYPNFCSNKCSQKSLITRNKIKKTCLEKFGKVTNLLIKEIQDSTIKTRKENYKKIYEKEMWTKYKKHNKLCFFIWKKLGNKRSKGNGICLQPNCNRETKWYNTNGYLFHVYCEKHKGSGTTSKLEKKIYNFIKKKFIKIEIKTNIYKIIKPYELDIYFPELNKAIEVNGTLYHADPKFYKENDKPHPFNDKTSKEIWIKDEIKLERCKEKNIKLLVLWEHDINNNWDSVKNEIIKFLEV